MPVIVAQNDDDFATKFAAANSGLAIVDFTATWCGPCQRIAPLFEKLSNDYASKGVKFFKVDVDKCSGTQGMYAVNAMPTFVFFKKGQVVSRMQGADPNGLTEKVREFVGANDALSVAAKNSPVPGYLDLTNFINKAGSECLNASDEHNLDRALLPGSAFYMESDCDEQIILNLAFQQPMKVHSMRILAPSENGPKVVKLFINVPRTPDFDSALAMEAIQKFELDTNDLVKGTPIPLRFVKFQNVQNICVFIENNQGSTDVTRVDNIAFFGQPVDSTNMGEFKRIAGEKGESH